MLFDLEDYRVFGITGVDRKSVENVNWGDSYTTWRATHDAYRNAVNYWFDAADIMVSAEDKHQLMVNYIYIMEKFTECRRKGKIFFDALASKTIPAEIVSANGITEGTPFIIFSVHQYEGWYNDFIDLQNIYHAVDQSTSPVLRKYVLATEQNSHWSQVINNTDHQPVYTTMTQAIYDAHKNALVDLQAKIKETYIIAEGISDIPEWIEPDVPAWYDSAELSGYVRDSRSLPISGATVRLVDAEGVNHDLVTNDLGYYHFTKEYIYNNISLGTASSAEFDMFVLEETISGTVLYSQTSIFQNSFFGAVNDRGLTWPVLVKSGKQNRRNFKIEFLPDYSAYPSVSGTVLDQDGNPVSDAWVQLSYAPLGVMVGSVYNSINGQWTLPSKYSLFGFENSILTDENGYYEYPSQLVGEWFNNNVKKANPNFQYNLTYNPYKSIKGVTLDSQLSNTSGFTYNGVQMDWGKIVGVEQADGKIVVGGLGFNEYNGVSTGPIFRMNTDGTIDDTFQVTMGNTNNSGYSYIQGMEKQADGKIIIIGEFDSINGNPAYCIARLNSDGTTDSTFNNTRLLYTSNNVGGEWDTTGQHYPNTMKIQPNGKILVGGFFYVPSVNMYGLIRLNSDGTIDDTFINGLDENGQPTLDSNGNILFGGAFEDPFAIELQSDGKILVGGSQWNGWFIDGSNVDWQNPPTTAIYRLNQDGSLDTTFSVGSAFFKNDNDDSGTPYSRIHDIKVDKNGKILVGGNFTKFNTVGSVHNIIRLNSNGTLDTAFPGLNWDGSPVEPWENYIANNNYNGIDRNGSSGIAVQSIYLNDDKILVFGCLQRTREDVGGMVTINHDGTIDQVVNVNSFVGFSNNNSNPPRVYGHVDLGNGSLMAFGRFAFFNDGNSEYASSPYSTVPNCNGVAKLKVDDMNLFAPLGNFGESGGNITLNDPALPTNSQGRYVINANSFRVVLAPNKMDINSQNLLQFDAETGPVSTRIYDWRDWFNSRFQYAFNERGEEYFKHIIPGENVINIREYLVDAEHGAERVYFDMVDKPTSLSENGFLMDISLDIQTKNSSGSLVNRFRIVFDNGEKMVINSQNYNFNYNFNCNWSSFYIYSCNEFGGAEGNISYIHFEGPITSLDLNELSALEVIETNYNNALLTSLDLSESNSKNTLNRISITSAKLTELNISGIVELDNLSIISDSECKIVGIDNCDIRNFNLNSSGNGAQPKFYTSKVPVIGNSLSYDNSAMRSRFGLDYKYSFGWPNDSGSGDILPTEDGGFIMLNDSTIVYKSVPGMNGFTLANDSYMPILKFDSNFDIDVNFSTKFSWFDYYRNWQNWDGSITTVSTHLDGSLLVALRGNSGNGNTLWEESYKGLIIKVDEGTGNANSTFSNNVKIAINPDQSATILKMHVCVDGKILVLGDYLGTEDYNGQSFNKKLIRLNTNGSLDTTFSFYTGSDIVGFEVLDDESILVFGDTMYNTKHLKQDVGVDYGRIVKISSNGTIDTVFSNNVNDAISNGYVEKLGVSDTGKILVYGVLGLNNFTSTSDIVYGNGSYWGPVMFNSDGTRDDVWINNLLSLTGYTAGEAANFPTCANEWPRRGSSILFHNGYFFIPTYIYGGLFKSDNQTGQQGYGFMISSDATSMSYITTGGGYGGWMSDVKVVSGKIVSIFTNTQNNLRYTVQDILPKYKYTLDLPGINADESEYSNWSLSNIKVDSLTFKRPFVNTGSLSLPYCDEIVIKSGFTHGKIDAYTFDSGSAQAIFNASPLFLNTKSLVKSDNSFVYNVSLQSTEFLTLFKEASYVEIYSSNDNIASDIDLTGFINLKQLSINNTSIRNSVIPQEVSNSIKSLNLYYSKGFENNGQYFVDFIEKFSNLDVLWIMYSYGGSGDLLPYKQELESAINSMSNLKSLHIENLWRKGYSTEVINIENDSIERFSGGKAMIQLTSDKIRIVMSYNQDNNYDYSSLKIIGGSYWLTNDVPQSDFIDWDFRLNDGTVVPAFRSYGFVPDVTGWVSLTAFSAFYTRFYQNHVNLSGLQNLKRIGISNLMVDHNSSSANIPWTYTPFTSTVVKNVYLYGESINIPSSLNNSILQNLIDVGTTSGIYDLHYRFDLTGMGPLQQTLIGRSWTFRIW